MREKENSFIENTFFCVIFLSRIRLFITEDENLRNTIAKKPPKPTALKTNQKTPQTPQVICKCGSKSENVNFNRYASKNHSLICTVCVVHMDYCI